MRGASKYDLDFHAWAMEQAGLLRAGRVAEADIAHIAEEIETLGRSERRELVSRLAVLLLHLLKWAHQPERRGKGWRLTIEEQRRQLARHLRDNPSLRAFVDDAMADAYGDAVLRAERETSLPRDLFPWSCPYGFEQAMDDGFWPEPG
ncbi:MAG: DUF29 domain-containing protein [Acetobacteraceae bacterium]|nr:DUF29 domain-containing protein [Acetobacteraceae bacterium]